jgi:hypothetical protein
MDVDESKEYKSFIVNLSHRNTTIAEASHYTLSFFYQCILGNRELGQDCPNCDTRTHCLDSDGNCSECDYYMAKEFPKLPVLPDSSDSRTFILEIINRLKVLEKKHDMKILNDQGHVYSTGFLDNE